MDQAAIDLTLLQHFEHYEVRVGSALETTPGKAQLLTCLTLSKYHISVAK